MEDGTKDKQKYYKIKNEFIYKKDMFVWERTHEKNYSKKINNVYFVVSVVLLKISLTPVSWFLEKKNSVCA